MKSLTLIAAFFTVFIHGRITASSQQSCDSLKWKFPVNQFAIDGNELLAELNNKGWDKNFFDEHYVKVIIEGATDCPGSFQYNTKLASNRALYLRNFFEMSGYPNVVIEDCYAFPEKGCTKKNQGYNRENRSVSLFLCAERRVIETVSEPVEPTEPPTTDEPENEISNLASLEPGQTLVIGGLNFYPGSHKTLPEAKPVMKKLAEMMKANPSLLIEVQGHVCCSKKPDEDGIDDLTGKPNLSWARAKEVYDFLVREGIDPERVTYKGYAMKKPLVYPEITIQDQIQNRRVEIMVVAK